MSGSSAAQATHARRPLLRLAIGALGVVYGDIGTSPLYALRECFHASTGIEPTHADVLGLLGLFFWSMTAVVTIKYVALVTRADNEGEGGILALLALVLPKRPSTKIPAFVLLGLFGAALLYADGMLTPAISVLSAVEGIDGIVPGLDRRVVVGVSVAILLTLFGLQSRGTGGIGAVFGPVMLVWFLTLGLLGAYWISTMPSVLWAIADPRHAIAFFVRHGLAGYLVLGSVVLCITGGEALYADMGHFGRSPIARAWTLFVWPMLILNYFGQGALLVAHPELHTDSFFAMVGTGWARIPLVLLATCATVIASQALISGAFSLTRQGMQLGYLPRLEIRHTSGSHEGQIYVPEVNWLLMTACIALVVGFQSSSRMAAAYGIAVTGTMAITTGLFFMVTRKRWGTARAGAIAAAMLIVDLAFFGANLVKIESGGWIPLAVATLILLAMTTWKRGRDRVGKSLRSRSLPLADFLAGVEIRHLPRVPGTAVFMTSSNHATPPVLLHHVRHNQALHEQVVLLSIATSAVPFVQREHRVEVETLGRGFHRVTARYGFMHTPSVTEVLRAAEKHGLHTDPRDTTFYLGREKLVVTHRAGLSYGRKLLFAFLSRNARSATDFFAIPPERVVEVGMQIEL